MIKQSAAAVLVGNGFSINIWDGFKYGTLFKLASLSTAAHSVFNELGTTNFEAALECLHHAHIVLKSLRKNIGAVDRTYEEVRDALFNAVNAAHVPREKLAIPTCTRVASTLAEHVSVYTTNYDLCLYWSHMQSAKQVDIKDYSWNARYTFEPGNASSGATLIHYLHGGLHLWTNDATGENGKWTTDTGSLLDLTSRYSPGAYERPLFVSEGTSEAKLRSIRQSSYLSFCLDRLRGDSANTVIFGHSLNDQDSHIVEALNAGPKRGLAISILPGRRPTGTVAEKARIQELLHRHRVFFFDSTTHPLGDRSLHI